MPKLKLKHIAWISGLEVIQLEYSLRLKINRNDWLLADTCPLAANLALSFESDNELKFYNLEARTSLIVSLQNMKSTINRLNNQICVTK